MLRLCRKRALRFCDDSVDRTDSYQGAAAALRLPRARAHRARSFGLARVDPWLPRDLARCEPVRRYTQHGHPHPHRPEFEAVIRRGVTEMSCHHDVFRAPPAPRRRQGLGAPPRHRGSAYRRCCAAPGTGRDQPLRGSLATSPGGGRHRSTRRLRVPSAPAPVLALRDAGRAGQVHHRQRRQPRCGHLRGLHPRAISTRTFGRRHEYGRVAERCLHRLDFGASGNRPARQGL